ncbi:MAG: aminoacyl-tRNA hydrolase [Legionellales bacterium RIFCSPHIGHO2_12_FULL_42_9]|nr:MAG: aminoacyl-tRNA hydrolase [Legionellales bacterium RIFCSPHIGHO2_12_FULL_42_9]
MAIKLIVGLRNLGSAYEATRHNAGGWFIETLIQHYPVSLKIDQKFHGEVGRFQIQDNNCLVLLPLTFMNQSGLPVREVSQFYRILPEEILIVHDDLDLPVGRVKLKTAGGNGGHNGLRDIIANLGSNAFYRLRVGIGHPGHKDLVLNYVLNKPSVADKQLICDAIENSMAIIPDLLAGKISAAMNMLNS